jgi:hypothetical protein
LIDGDACESGKLQVTYTPEIVDDQDRFVSMVERDESAVWIKFVQKKFEKFRRQFG